jgi:non-homologous end joining protein Ku
MRGTNRQLVVTTVTEEATGAEIPKFAFPVQMCKVLDTAEPRFDRAAPSGAEYDTVYRDRVTGQIHESGDLIRGVRTGDSFAAIDAEVIKAIDENLKSDQIVVERGCLKSEVPFDLATDRHFLQVPAKAGGASQYRLLFEALKGVEKGKGKREARALRVRFGATSRVKMGVVWADEDRGCLMLTTLAFAAQVRSPDEQVLSHLQAEVPAEHVSKMREIVEALDVEARGSFADPVDPTPAAREALIAEALAGEAIEVPEGEAPVVVVEAATLSAALEESLAALAA